MCTAEALCKCEYVRMAYKSIPSDPEGSLPHFTTPQDSLTSPHPKLPNNAWSEPGTGWATSDIRESSPLVRVWIPKPMLNTSDNTIVLYRLADLRQMSASNYNLAVIAVSGCVFACVPRALQPPASKPDSSA